MGLFADSVLLPDGRVFYVPSDATNAQIFDPNTGNLTEIDSDLDNSSKKFSRGVLLTDGRVACIPLRLDHIYILEKNDSGEDIFFQSDATVRPTGYNTHVSLYSDGVLLTDGTVMLVPDTMGQLGIWNPKKDAFELLGHPKMNSTNLRGQLLPDGTVFLVSRLSNQHVYRWDPRDSIGIQKGPIWNDGVQKTSIDESGVLMAISSSSPPRLIRWSLQTGRIDPTFSRFVS